MADTEHKNNLFDNVEVYKLHTMLYIVENKNLNLMANTDFTDMCMTMAHHMHTYYSKPHGFFSTTACTRHCKRRRNKVSRNYTLKRIALFSFDPILWSLWIVYKMVNNKADLFRSFLNCRLIIRCMQIKINNTTNSG